MRRTSMDLARLLGTLMENQIPSIGFLSAFPEALGLPHTGAPRRKTDPNPEELQRKVNILVNCGLEGRKSMGVWRSIEDEYLKQPSEVARFIEEASFKLRQTVLLEDEDAIDLGDEEAEPSSPERARAEAEQTLDEIAQEVIASAPDGLFGGDPLEGKPQAPSTSPQQQERQLLHLSKVIHGSLKYRQEPYEWVYDGLKPLLLDCVAQSREGIHASLASLYTAVGRRVNCCVLPEFAAESNSSRASAIEAGLSLATAPAPDPCLVRIEAGRQAQSSYFLEPTTGEVFDAKAGQKRFPGLHQVSPATPLGFWTGLVRIAMTAHQRRGDGDAVAHCMHQLLALDMNAPEWASALRPAAIRR